MDRYYRFAGISFKITGDDSFFPENERSLAPFRVDSAEDAHTFRLERVEHLAEPVGKCIVSEPGFGVFADGDVTRRHFVRRLSRWDSCYMVAEHRGQEHRVLFRSESDSGRLSVKYLLSAMGAEHLIARAGGFVFHCAYIDYGGRAILFTAPSGTGKSTQAELWKQFCGAEIINGDRAAVRVVGDSILAEGIPFSGSSQYCLNRSLPLAAVVYLAQAPETSVRRILGYEAFSRVWEGCSINTWDPQDMALVSDSVCRVVAHVPVFHMPCRPDESAVLALENALKEVIV